MVKRQGESIAADVQCKTYYAALDEMKAAPKSLSSDPLPVVLRYDTLDTAQFALS